VSGESPREALSELAKLGARLIIQRAVEDEFDAWLGRARYERRPEAPPGPRNGFRPRRVQTAEGELEVEIPQVREAAEPFVSRLFARGTTLLRTEPLRAMVIGAFVRGLSMRDVESLCEQAGLGKLSKSTAARICSELRERFEAFGRRDLKPPSDLVSFARLSPDGRLIALGLQAGTQVWSTTDWTPVTRTFTGQAGFAHWAAISSDNRTLATTSTDGTVRLWDIESEQPVGAPLPGLPGHWGIPLLTPDGTALIAGYDTGRAFRWDIRPSSLIRHACSIAGRTLTRAEWDEYLPGRDYDPACTN
jgi:hypothetical protein